MKEILFYKPSINHKESKEINDVLDLNDCESKIKQLEENFAKYTGYEHIVATSSGTAAMHLSLCALDLKRGDKVLMPVNAFASMPEVVRHFDAEPIFVDIDKQTYNVDLKALEDSLKKYNHKKLRAICINHMAGLMCNMREISWLANEYNVEIIEDASHSLGAKTVHKAGSKDSIASIFSFSPNRSSGIINGGILATNSEEIAKRARLLRNHALATDGWDKHGTLDYIYDVIDIGCKYDMSQLHAAFAIAQLAKNDEFIKRRREIAKIYNEELSSLPHIELPQYDKEHTYFHYIIKIDKNRDHFARQLKQKGIQTALHFIPLHLLSYYKHKYELKVNAFPNALSNYQQILTLPIYPKMEDSEVMYVCKTIKELLVNRI